MRWPFWLIEAMRQMRYCISPMELWTELALLTILLRVQKRCVHTFVTDFTDGWLNLREEISNVGFSLDCFRF